MNMFGKLGVVAGALVLSAAGIAPAQAARYTHGDAAKDQTRTTCTDTGTCSDAVDPTATNGDIVRVVAVHASRKVLVATKYSNLATSTEDTMQLVRIVTNTGLQRFAVIHTPANSNNATVFLARPNGDPVKCRYIGAARDTTANVMELKVPRSCLGRPRWVKVGVGHLTGLGEASVQDDALRNGSVGSNITLSTRIRRG
jgi:hypothetical protein